MMIGRKDARVLKSFSEQRPEVGHKLTTDGVRLDGLWMGGTGIAAWSGGKIELGDLGSKAALSVQRSLMAYVAPNDIRKSNPHGSDPAGVCESCMKQGRPGERWGNADICDDCAYDYAQIRYGSAAEKAAAKKALKARQAHSMRKNPAKRRRNPNVVGGYDWSQPEPEFGQVLATTINDRRLLMDALGCVLGELGNGKLTAGQRAYRERVREMYQRIANL